MTLFDVIPLDLYTNYNGIIKISEMENTHICLQQKTRIKNCKNFDFGNYQATSPCKNDGICIPNVLCVLMRGRH